MTAGDPRIRQTETAPPPRPEEDVADGAVAADGGDTADGAPAADGAATSEQDATWFEGDPPEADIVEPVAAVSEEPGDVADLRERAAKADEYLALAQRAQADFENFRRRMTRDLGAAEARGLGRLAKELLPALDNLERALAAAEATGTGDGPEHHLAEGIRLVQAELSAGLARAGIEGFHPKGEVFDPARHEAMAQAPADGAEPGTIVEVYQQGYRLADTILRPARVVVAA